MKTHFLFPHRWRTIGYLCFVIDIVFSIILKILHPAGEAKELGQAAPDGMILHNDIHILLPILGLLLIAFSKEKIEDEQIVKLRLDSLQLAIYANYGIFIICVIFVNGLGFLTIVAYNVITPLIFFIICFRWKIYQLNRLLKIS